jgi:hypothetical protein
MTMMPPSDLGAAGAGGERGFARVLDDALHRRGKHIEGNLEEMLRGRFLREGERAVKASPGRARDAARDLERFAERMADSADGRDSIMVDDRDFAAARARCGLWPWCVIFT